LTNIPILYSQYTAHFNYERQTTDINAKKSQTGCTQKYKLAVTPFKDVFFFKKVGRIFLYLQTLQEI